MPILHTTKAVNHVRSEPEWRKHVPRSATKYRDTRDNADSSYNIEYFIRAFFSKGVKVMLATRQIPKTVIFSTS